MPEKDNQLSESKNSLDLKPLNLSNSMHLRTCNASKILEMCIYREREMCCLVDLYVSECENTGLARTHTHTCMHLFLLLFIVQAY